MTRRRITPRQRAKISPTRAASATSAAARSQAQSAGMWSTSFPLSMGGDDDFNNMRPAHAACHQAKTADDAGNLAKARRVEAKHIGAHRPKQRINPRAVRNSDRSLKEKLSSEAIWARKNARNAGDEQ